MLFWGCYDKKRRGRTFEGTQFEDHEHLEEPAKLADINRLSSFFHVIVQAFRSLGADARVQMSRSDADSSLASLASGKKNAFIISSDYDFLWTPDICFIDGDTVEFPVPVRLILLPYALTAHT